MNKTFFVSTISITLLVSAFFAKDTIAADYVALSNTFIASARGEITDYVNRYEAVKNTFSEIQQQQIESQYNGISNALTTISKNEQKDTGINLQNDYTSLLSLNIDKLKMPILNSELFNFKVQYLLRQLVQFNAQMVPGIISKISSKNHQQALNDGEAISSSISLIQTEEMAITSDYSKLSDLQSQEDNAKIQNSEHAVLVEIMQSQQSIIQNINQIINSINDLETLQ